MKYRVFGHTTVVVTMIVTADSKEEAYEKASGQMPSLESFAGNGGYDKIVGVSGADNTVDVVEGIEWDDIEFLAD